MIFYIIGVAATLVILSTFLLISNTIPLKIEDIDTDEILDGDIRIPVKMMLQYYNFSSFRGGEQILQKLKKIVSNMSTGININNTFQTEAASTLRNDLLWGNGIIPYKISSMFSDESLDIIKKGMKNWEDNTCLRFVPAEEQHVDYIDIVKKGSSCHSAVGRQGGRQILNLVSWCETIGHVSHELGHSIGLWHEQNRADRDKYIKLNTSNIKDGKDVNFAKIQKNKMDHQGSTYDFGSVMHYHLFAFSKHKCHEPWCQTMHIKNSKEFRKQGNPNIGQRIGPSKRDIEEANRLYSCPGRGITGMFFIQVILGKFQHNYGNTSSIYVKLIIVYSNGTESTYQSSHKRATSDVTWNETILSGRNDLQFFRISTWYTSFGNVRQITNSETFPVNPGTHHNLKNCGSINCSTYVLFKYTLIPDTMQSSAMQIIIRTPFFLVAHFCITLNNYNYDIAYNAEQ